MLIRYKEVCAGQQKFLTVWRELLMGHCVSNGPGRDARLVKIHLPLCWLCLLELWVRWVFTRRFPPWRPGRSRDCTNTRGKAQTHSSHWETTVWTVGHHGFWACFGRKTIWVWEKLNLNIIIQIIYLTRHLEEKKKQRPTCQDTDNRTILLGELHPILFCNCLQNETLTGFPQMGCGPRELFGLFLQKCRGWEWENVLQKLFEIRLFTRIEGCLPEGCWQQGRGVT